MNDHTIADASTLHGWRRSKYSGNEGGSCIEVLDGYPTGVPVRDSKAPQGPALVFPSAGWASFVAGVKNGYLST
ncbi:DUF397 domain-containing protein [Streptomyces sp. NPDC086080]|uniref:DUF397 domain-containing protein n=1 Tax=Streptomyces sp. NPDC086080 TaxID=3365748 RepID=UPI0037D042CF